MVDQVNQLMNSNYQNQRRMRKLELQALQEQINPHFLYNSLDSIKWLIRMNRIDEAIGMVKNLSLLYRISLSHGREIITVRDEIRHVRAYLDLQRQEYKSKFTYEIHADESTYDYLTPKIILQPLVENSLSHGVGNARREIHITVSVLEAGKKIHMIVSDDGTGIPADKLMQINAGLRGNTRGKDPAPEAESGGYGMKNVNDRIRLYFSDDCGIFIDSEPDKGTTVTVVIDKITENLREDL